MTYEITVNQKKMYISARYFGKAQMEEIKQAMDWVLALQKKHGITRVILDTFEVDLELKTIDYYSLAEHLAKLVRPKMRFAVVVRAGNENNNLFEDAAINRDVEIRLFTNTDAANDWLFVDNGMTLN